MTLTAVRRNDENGFIGQRTAKRKLFIVQYELKTAIMTLCYDNWRLIWQGKTNIVYDLIRNDPGWMS